MADFLGFLKRQRKEIRFVVVGLWNTVFGYLVFLLFVELSSRIFSLPQLAYMVGFILANVVAILNAFFFHRFITFRSQVHGLAILTELVKFSSTYLFTFFLSAFLLPVFIEIFHLTTPVAGALVLLVCTVISYLGHSRFSFGKHTAR